VKVQVKDAPCPQLQLTCARHVTCATYLCCYCYKCNLRFDYKGARERGRKRARQRRSKTTMTGASQQHACMQAAQPSAHRSMILRLLCMAAECTMSISFLLPPTSSSASSSSVLSSFLFLLALAACVYHVPLYHVPLFSLNLALSLFSHNVATMQLRLPQPQRHARGRMRGGAGGGDTMEAFSLAMRWRWMSSV
jgi:hypothetical protein